MNSKWLSALVVGLLSSFCAMSVFGQLQKTPTLGQYIISAKAGGVNFVEGKVNVIRQAGTSGLLLSGDEIQIGDKVSTGDDGMAEILLNPGSFVRLGHNSSFDFGSTDLENLKMNLRAGSAVLELFATDDFKVSIKLPQSEMQLTRSGVFRIDVMSDGSARISVIKGKAFVGPAGTTEVDAGRMASVTRSGVSVSKFDKGAADSLDIFSKSRSKELASLNAHLQANSLRNSLLSSFNNGGWDMYRSFGLWVCDPRTRGWAFLPFGYGWASPYGWEYGWNLWRFNMPYYLWTPSYYPSAPAGAGGGTNSTPTSTGGGVSPATAQINAQRTERIHTPPFQRAEQSSRVESNTVGIGNSFPAGRGRTESSGSGETRSTSEPKSFPSPVSSPPIMAPTSTPTEASSSAAKGKPGN